ncbi:MAG: hypothetical protein ACM34K_09250 [Bacillota bacterium]
MNSYRLDYTNNCGDLVRGALSIAGIILRESEIFTVTRPNTQIAEIKNKVKKQKKEKTQKNNKQENNNSRYQGNYDRQPQSVFVGW